MSYQDPYSHQPPHLRPQYTPANVPPYPTSNSQFSQPGPYHAPPLTGQHYSQPPNYTPLESQPMSVNGDQVRDWRGRVGTRGRYYPEDNEDGYSDYSDAAPSYRSNHSGRPRAIALRSSSHPGHFDRGREVAWQNKRRGSGSSYSSSDDDDDRGYAHNEKYNHRHSSESGTDVGGSSLRPVHPKMSSHFTKSPSGLGAGAVGLVAGGWLARKAQHHAGHGKQDGGSAFLTLMGAAVGGLALNAVAERVEEKKMKERERRREQSWDGGSRRGSSVGSRETRRSDWGDDRY